MKKTHKEVLVEARGLIENEENWMKNDYCNEDATCFCSVGAVMKAVCGDDLKCPAQFAWKDGIDFSAYFGILTKATPSKRRPVARFNDDPKTTHADVLKMFDRAIAKA